MINIQIERIGDTMWNMDRLDLKDVPAVYFIYNTNKELIYIGQTQKLLTRTVSHFYADMWFKLFAKYLSYREVNTEDLRKEETLMIQEFRPKYNFEHYCPVSDGEMRDAIREKPIL